LNKTKGCLIANFATVPILKNCLLSAAAQLHRPLSWLCFQMYAILLLQLMDHRKQVTRLGIPFRPEHPYETHARLLLL
ncbi:hypothetical protein, partial [Escherichia coli]|uniref:hypothetical protein n=3 Tax=Escherichia coli TaxID=562 RepID=UPI0030C78207